MVKASFSHPLVRLGLAGGLAWLFCAAFLDPGIMAQARDFNGSAIRSLLARSAQLGMPLPWVGLLVLWGLLRRATVGGRVLFALFAWAGTTLLVDLISIVGGHYHPRTAIESLVGTATDRASELALLGNNAEGLWGLIAAGLAVAPAPWRPMLLILGGLTSMIRVVAGEVYLGDAILAALLALMVAAAMRRWAPAPAH
ncbi:hypothetical protein [Magnetospira sp. QH-2]|uniref:hypothetical protein n=1 Tax=Magnetospira sp. (strain QH-2) TaxID=1288970 RepID=UPI0003E81A18|nr:hypothetical protein [Magnetospira sp. QH-2]CCQ75052.1 membrane protein of unknown function [Magnetospira sp. QH-2]